MLAAERFETGSNFRPATIPYYSHIAALLKRGLRAVFSWTCSLLPKSRVVKHWRRRAQVKHAFHNLMTKLIPMSARSAFYPSCRKNRELWAHEREGWGRLYLKGSMQTFCGSAITLVKGKKAPTAAGRDPTSIAPYLARIL